MLVSFFSWWLARITELLPTTLTNAASRPRDGIVVDVDATQNVITSIRKSGKSEQVSIGAAARQGGRLPVLVRPPVGLVLVKHHTVPAAPRGQLDQILRHELARITPFPADDLFWRWDGHPRSENKTRIDVTLTMVARKTLAPALAVLANEGLTTDFVEVGSAERPSLLTIGGSDRATTGLFDRGLAGLCAVLGLTALVLPLGLQAFALYRTEAAIAELQPVIAQVETLRRNLMAGDAGRDILLKEMERTGDVLQTLASVTRILPDDTYLTDFSLRDRQMTISGRSASAPRLITGLSADPAIRNAAFAAPVTRIEGATSDVFSIKAEVAK